MKNDLYTSLHSEFKSKTTMFSPASFIEEYVPDEYRKPFREHMEVQKVPLTSFKKDLSDISSRLRRRSIETNRNVTVSVPEDEAELVTVTDDEIVIHDSVLRVR